MKEKLRFLNDSLNKVYGTKRKIILQKCQNYGLYVGQPQILDYIRKHPGCTQTEIAAELGVSAASIAFSTKRLQKADFLQKQVNHLNMRCNKLYVTPEGLDVLERFEKDFEKVNNAMFDGFSESEVLLLTSFAERVSANLDNVQTEE